MGDHITNPEQKAADDNGRGNISFLQICVEVHSGSEFIEGFVTEDEKQDGDDSKGDGDSEIGQEVIREMQVHY
ncbi:MAG: hypothetical protein JWQ71_606 [Pedosphaera sp.]|nr:hypothetical protein [Pedosphaera sp.]